MNTRKHTLVKKHSQVTDSDEYSNKLQNLCNVVIKEKTLDELKEWKANIYSTIDKVLELKQKAIEVNDSETKHKKQKIEANESSSVYPKIHGLDYELFQLSPEGLTDECQRKALEQLETYLKKQQQNFLGYQLNENVHYSKKLSFMLDVQTNNIGDPFVSGNCTVNTKIMERTVLDYFANLWHAQIPSKQSNPESYWGYVLSMGSTEGNLYALYNARDYLKGKALFKENKHLSYIRPVTETENPHAYHPVAFYSDDTHYSITKIVRALEIQTFYEIGEKEYKGQCPITSDGTWPKEVPSKNGNNGPGSVDIDKLIQLVEFFAATGSPPLIILNVGTTFKGAYDDVEEIGNRLMPILKRYKLDERIVNYDPADQTKCDTRTGYWIHVDGALGASYLPFIEKAYETGRMQQRGPKFDFSLKFVHSIVTSAHKYPGCPMPSGIYMTKHKYQIAPPDDPEYLGSPDTTFAGSRNAISPAALWCYYANTSVEKEITKAIEVENIAKYAEEKLTELDQNVYHGQLWVGRTPLSLALRFRKPNDDIIFKYSLSEMSLELDGVKTEYVHMFVMQSVTKEKIDELVHDLKQKNAFVFKPLLPVSTRKEKSNVHRIAHVPINSRGYSGN
ncbi:unnamed protein product [Didymodactylos carnosus]|uniref:Histidine decarboxylase n=1 Tax=Didymodactylos carnosus TaxID=1234261 RepID=A0A8S2F2H7_9BILA|nr:unnamed protein product [Didymodactylos carnosus]CAF4134381.1 unnamed protein product [Didymodactylos carnosus]